MSPREAGVTRASMAARSSAVRSSKSQPFFSQVLTMRPTMEWASRKGMPLSLIHIFLLFKQKCTKTGNLHSF